MNGRVFAVNRSPVLAWNIDPQLQAYPDMPAAAAISPAPPPADPYARCYQHVDAAGTGTSFPYFGALYNNSLPPAAYRLQPGCMPALGQFWPPTPPPDGCGRYDGSNLYFGPPVLRHTENISSNIRSSFQGLGHYSQLIETSKDQNQRLFKRESSISPNVSVPNIAVCSSISKTDNLNSCCVVDSKMKSPSSVAYSLPKQELHTVSSGHEPYLCSSDIRSSSMHPSTEKSHYSPSHSLKNTLNFHSTSQDNTHRTKAMAANQENCNASPLKNVYFSHYESENINFIHSKNFEKTSSERQFQYESRPNSSMSKSLHSHQPPNNYLPNYAPKKYDFQSSQDHLSHNGSLNSNAMRGDRTTDAITVIKEKHKQKSSSYKVKPEKSHSDCKYQKRSALAQRPEYKNSEMFNIPTSVLHAKMEPNDKYFLPSCSTTAPSCMAASYATSGPFFKDHISADLRTGVSYQNSIYQNSCSLGKSWHYSDLPAISLENYFRSPEAAKPPSQNQSHVSSALHEGLISVAQTAPQDIGLPTHRLLHNSVQLPPSKRKAPEMDDDVQIIGVQTKQSSAKHESRNSSERKPNWHEPIPVSEPLCLKSEKEERNVKPRLSTPEENCQTSITPPCNPPILQIEESIKPIIEEREKNIEHLNSSTNNSDSNINPPIHSSSNKTIPNIVIKQELLNESDLPTAHCAELVQEKPTVIDNENHSLDSKFDSNNKISNKSLDSEIVASKIDNLELDHETVYNENHGLNLLLNTIEKVTSFEKVKCPNPVPLSTTPNEVVPQVDKREDINTSCKKRPKIRGLDLLSAIAEQRLVSEFDVVKLETNEEHIKCNYPEIKEVKLLPEEDQKQTSEPPVSAAKSSVSEIQNILVELKKKYKQKQKELSRLKPKHRFASSYLKGRQSTIKKEFDPNSSFTTTSSLNSSFSSVCSEEEVQNANQHDTTVDSKSKIECKKDSVESKSKRGSRVCVVKKEPTEETTAELSNKRITRRSLGKSKSGDKVLEVSEHSKAIKRNSRSKTCKLRKSQHLSAKEIPHASDSSISKPTLLNKEIVKKCNSLPENRRRKKVYSLRHLSRSSNRKVESSADDSATHSKAISSKRKSDNPKKFIASKQSKLSETIIAKHLRSRILFDTSGSTSDDDNLKDGVPDDLYVAFEECHLGEETKNGSKGVRNIKASKLSSDSLAYPEPSRLCPENLKERQRLLALEDGLFYAGCIKEYQVSKKYGIALDGQRGNRLHMFTREELLTQTIVESKPLTSDLPEGTRVCAYWSQQYRCLYPGVVGKAPCPSADWSEPRVFVLFDDGDSGQIPAKNVRLIPPDIIPAENICRSDSSNTSSSSANLKSRSTSRGQSHRLKSITPKDTKQSDTSNENESKESSCTSINESSCDDSCFVDYSLSPSHTPSDQNNSQHNSKSVKRQRKRSKRRTSRRDLDSKLSKSEAKAKRHKKYREKHRRHHHHHHRHHHHHHHHHHSKKRRHKRKTPKTASQDCIPCDLKSDSDLMGHHSSAENLPQREQGGV